MNKSDFKKIITTYQEAQEAVDKFNELGLNLFETAPITHYETIINQLLLSVFTQEGVDWIYWWLFEKHGTFGDENLQAYDKDSNVIPTDTLDELWDNILTEHIL